jgi:hypothetical protein
MIGNMMADFRKLQTAVHTVWTRGNRVPGREDTFKQLEQRRMGLGVKRRDKKKLVRLFN